MPDTRIPLIVVPIILAGVLYARLGAGGFTWLLIGLALACALYKAAKWAFWPRHALPRHRIRHLKLRLFLRLHPGPGHATVAELHRHWGRRASALKDRYARP